MSTDTYNQAGQLCAERGPFWRELEMAEYDAAEPAKLAAIAEAEAQVADAKAAAAHLVAERARSHAEYHQARVADAGRALDAWDADHGGYVPGRDGCPWQGTSAAGGYAFCARTLGHGDDHHFTLYDTAREAAQEGAGV